MNNKNNTFADSLNCCYKYTRVSYEVASRCLKVFVWLPSRLTWPDKFIRDGKRRRAEPNVRATARRIRRSPAFVVFSRHIPRSEIIWCKGTLLFSVCSLRRTSVTLISSSSPRGCKTSEAEGILMSRQLHVFVYEDVAESSPLWSASDPRV